MREMCNENSTVEVVSIPSEIRSVSIARHAGNHISKTSLNPFGNQVSFDSKDSDGAWPGGRVSIPSEIRSVSISRVRRKNPRKPRSLNPFGNQVSFDLELSLETLFFDRPYVSIPSEIRSVSIRYYCDNCEENYSLNPFGNQVSFDKLKAAIKSIT